MSMMARRRRSPETEKSVFEAEADTEGLETVRPEAEPETVPELETETEVLETERLETERVPELET